MPDQYGNPTEAELRGQQAPSAPQGQVVPIFDGVIGGHRVQLYGAPGQARLTQQQAIQYLANDGSNKQAAANGSLDPAYWAAINPGATPEQIKAYSSLHNAYRAQTSGMSLGDKALNAAEFEVDRFGNLVKNVANNPGQLLTGGIDPIGTKVGNTLTGSNNEALVGQFGGATNEDFRRYEDRNGFGSLGAAREFSHSADNIAAIGGAAGAAHGLGQAFGHLTGASDIPTQTYRGGANLNYSGGPIGEVGAGGGGAVGEALPEIVVEGTRGGLSLGQIAGIGAGVAGAGALASSGSGMSNTADPVKSFGNAQTGGNAGQLADSGGIEGGAGANGGGGMGFGGGSGGGWLDTLIDTGIDLGGAYLSGSAAKDASREQAAAAAAAIAEQRRQYDLNREDLKPYREAGSTAIGQLSAGTAEGGDFNRDFTLADFQKDPGYQFRMDEGVNAIQGANAATRGVQNGRTLAELIRYGHDYASGEYSNAYNRFNNDRTTRFNRLGSLAGIGQTATNTGVASGSNSTNNIADLTLDQANARAAGRIGEANAYVNGAESLANLYRNRKYGGSNTNWIGG